MEMEEFTRLSASGGIERGIDLKYHPIHPKSGPFAGCFPFPYAPIQPGFLPILTSTFPFEVVHFQRCY